MDTEVKGAPTEPSQPPNSKPKRPKTTPKKSTEERFEEQKKALQKVVILSIRRGKTSGLNAAEVVAVEEALQVLGWLPRDLQL